MNLKESFQYQNFLEDLFTQGSYLLQNQAYATITEQRHLRKKVYAEAEDTTEIENANKPFEFNILNIADFAQAVLDEKERLCDAIDGAKRGLPKNIDTAVTLNKRKNQLLGVLKRMAVLKQTTAKQRGVAHKFNVAGDQVPYNYEIEVVKSIDFDRNQLTGMIKRISKETADTSKEVDKLMVNTDLEFSPAFDMTLSPNEVMEEFVKGLAKPETETMKE